MAHHGQENFKWQEDALRELQGQLGGTDKFPQGKLTEDDEGEIKMAVAVQGKKVIVDFGKPTAWIGMDAQQAADLAALLIYHAKELAKTSGQPLTVFI